MTLAPSKKKERRPMIFLARILSSESRSAKIRTQIRLIAYSSETKMSRYPYRESTAVAVQSVIPFWLRAISSMRLRLTSPRYSASPALKRMRTPSSRRLASSAYRSSSSIVFGFERLESFQLFYLAFEPANRRDAPGNDPGQYDDDRAHCSYG